MTREDIRIEVLSDPRLLRAIRGLVRAYISSFGFSPDRTEEVVLGVDEACTNAIRHAYKGRPDQRLVLTFSTQDESIEITLRDSGHPALSSQIARKELEPAVPAKVAVGGLGVQLIYKIFDEVEFCPGVRRGNCLTMRLKPVTRRR